MNPRAGLLLLAALGLLVLLASCGAQRYPLVVLEDRVYLEARDRTGALVRFAVDTGSDRSLLSRRWVEKVGARLVPGPPGSWDGIRLGTRWRSRAVDVPVPPGIPPFLEGLPAATDGPLSPLSGPVPTVGLLGTDVLWDWAIDFRGDTPWLVRDAGADPDRVTANLVQDGGRYTTNIVALADGFPALSGRAVVDTGSPFSLLVFQSEPTYGVEAVANSRSPVTANGTRTHFLDLEVEVGEAHLGTVVVLDGELAGPPVVLLGTPALQALRAVLNLRDWTLSIDRTARPIPLTSDSPEAWGWSATLVPQKGIHLDHVLPSSILGRKGLSTGDWITKIGGQPAWAPRSVIEWRRVWIDLATAHF